MLLHEKYIHLDRVEDLLPLSLQITRFKIMALRRKAVRHWELPPQPWLWPVVKFVNDILYVPPTRTSAWCTFPVNPFGGSHFTFASASRNARYARSGGHRSTR